MIDSKSSYVAIPADVHQLMVLAIAIYATIVGVGPMVSAQGADSTSTSLGISNVFLVWMVALPLVTNHWRRGLLDPLVVIAGLTLSQMMLRESGVFVFGLNAEVGTTSDRDVIIGLQCYVNFIRGVAALATYVGFYSLSRPAPIFLAPMRRHDRQVQGVLVVAFAVTVIALVLYVALSGGLMAHLKNITRGWANKVFVDDVTSVGQYLTLISFAPNILLIWLVYRPQTIRNPATWIAVVTVLGMSFLGNGRRSAVILEGLVLFIGWSLGRRRVYYPALLCIGAAAFLLIGLLGLYRWSNWRGREVNLDFWRQQSISSVAAVSYEELVRRTEGGAIYRIVHHVPKDTSLLLGTSYLEGVLKTFVPRLIWPTKPRGIGIRCAEEFFGRHGTGGIPPSAHGEAYWNGHLPGVIIVFLLYGMGLRWLDAFFRAQPQHVAAIVIYAFLTVRFEPTTVAFQKVVHQLILLLIVLRCAGLLQLRKSVRKRR